MHFFWHLHKIVLQAQNDLISDQTQKQYHMCAVIQIVSYVVPEVFALSAEKKKTSPLKIQIISVANILQK